MRFLIPVILVFLFLPGTLYAKETLHVAGLETTKINYDKLVAEKGGDPFKISNYGSQYASRPVISLLIMVQALHTGGMDPKIEYHPYPNHNRSITDLKKGKTHILASDMWEQCFDGTVYKSSPFIRKGEFEKGIYTHAHSPLLKTRPDLQPLLKLTPITELAWKIDLDLFRRMGFKKIETAPTYSLLFKMLNHKRADFTLLEFSGDSKRHYMDNEILYLVKGVKIIFPYSRHFMISKKHPGSRKIYETLEQGLKVMRENGTIERALYQARIKTRWAEKWKTIWPPQTANQTQIQ